MQTTENPLRAAIRKGDLEAVRRAVASGSDVNQRAAGQENKTPLHYAAARGDTRLLEALLELGADAGARDSSGETALGMAAYRGRIDCVRVLLARKVDVNPRTRAGWTPLMAAASEGHAEVVRLLLAAGAQPSERAAGLAERYRHAAVATLIRQAR